LGGEPADETYGVGGANRREGTDGGIYAVRAASREDCVQLLFREKVTLTDGYDPTDVLDRIHENVWQAKTFALRKKFQHAKIVEELESRWDDYL
jgi:hypothetical protein